MKKRVLSAFMALCMMVTLIPNTVYAQATTTEGNPCEHHIEHTPECGYTEDTPCTFECLECNPKDSGNVALGTSSITVTAFDKLEGAVQQRTVPVGTTLEQLDLPTTLAATGFTVSDTKVADSGTPPDATTTPAAISIEGVAWEIDPKNENNQGNSTYDPEQGSYCFTPILPEGYTLAESVKLPEIWVRVDGVALMAATTVNAGAFTLTADSPLTADTDYTYSNNTLTIKTNTAVTIAMASGVTSTSADKIVVPTDNTNANITLDGVNIDVSGTDKACAFELQGSAKVNLTLVGANALKSGNKRAGLQVQTKDGATAELIITAASTGSLNATGGGYGAGIGGGDVEGSGTITINGGTVTATGGVCAAGIGGGDKNGGGTITINSGTIVATAPNSNGDPAAIGGGGYGDAGTISITGGHITANGSQKGIGGGTGKTGGSITISGGVVIANGIGGTLINTSITGNSFVVSGSGGINQTNKTNWSGVIFGGETDDKSAGAVYGTSITLKTDAEIPVGKTLTIGTGESLTIDTGVTLNNKGTITVDSNGTLINNGTLNNRDTIVNNGTFTNNSIFNNYGTITNPPTDGTINTAVTGGDTTPSPPSNVINNTVGSGTLSLLADTVKTAVAAGKTTATAYINYANYQALTVDGLKAISDAAAVATKGAALRLGTRIQLDSTLGNAVLSRITVDPAKLSAVMPNRLGLRVWFDQATDAGVVAVKGTFDKYFANKLYVITFEQATPLAVSMELALKPDMSKLNTKNLHFYSYNPTTNIYRRIAAPAYWVDKNGYSHITAPLGGSIIITDSPLTRK